MLSGAGPRRSRRVAAQGLQGNVDKAVLAYSGGLDTSVILKWLKEEYSCEVITFTADLGQVRFLPPTYATAGSHSGHVLAPRVPEGCAAVALTAAAGSVRQSRAALRGGAVVSRGNSPPHLQGEELEPARKKAEEYGVKQIFIDDLREEFVKDFVFPMFRGNGLYEGIYLLGTSIARPLIAKRQIEIAKEVGADAVSHGATGKGNDQIRFEVGYYALKPDVKVIAPWREWDLTSRTKLISYAEAAGIPVPESKRGALLPAATPAARRSAVLCVSDSRVQVSHRFRWTPTCSTFRTKATR